MAFAQEGLPFHSGESEIQRRLHVPSRDNPTFPMLSPQAASHLQRAPLIAIGTLDSQGQPWTTVWGGAPGLSQPLGRSVIGIKTAVDSKFDPVIQALFGGKNDGEVVKEEGEGRMIAGLTIDLETRKRVKIYGRMVAGAVAAVEEQPQVQLVMRVDQSLGNCPKYLNSKRIRRAQTSAELVSDSPDLIPEAVDLIKSSDLFFLSSSNSSYDMDTNHRGGPQGFVRHHRTPSGFHELFWPEYSGNRLYQTLGNLQTTPLAGLVFPNFTSGNVLYVTGTTETLIGKAASVVLARSNLVVKLTVTAARFVRNGLPFRGDAGEASPYNPLVRPLASEGMGQSLQEIEGQTTNTATLLEQIPITSTISRFRFSMTNQTRWEPGEWVAFDFSSELDIGYSHMRDDDPRSLNDDFIRTFTVSSPPAPRKDKSSSDDEFEITIRKVGVVTDFLFKQHGRNKLELPIRGFGGEVRIEQDKDGITPVIVGGIGVTPLMAQLLFLDLARLKVFWTTQVDDLNLVLDVLRLWPSPKTCLSLFVTGATAETQPQHKSAMMQIEALGIHCELRRLKREDLDFHGLSKRWHVCVSTNLRKVILEWLAGKEIIYEDFNF